MSQSSGSCTDEDEARELLIQEKSNQQKSQQRRKGKQPISKDQQDIELARYLQKQEQKSINDRLKADLEFARQLQQQLEQEENNHKNNNGASSSNDFAFYKRSPIEVLEGDLALARQLQLEEEQEYEKKQNSNNNNRKSHSPVTAIPDPSNELIDPTPDLHELFLAFDQQYFKGQLASVEVKWSKRMTLCAGICEYQPGGYVVIKLSEPLLKFRSREDMVNTLLHEMIHALLFIQMKISDHDGHGPEFLQHANRINKSAKTNITVYHNFHDEVEHYRTHVWLCDGPCRERPPYYGKVSRSMNRPPQKADTWFHEHQITCGGTFTKIAEPEGFKDKKNKMNSKKRSISKITDFFKDFDEEVKIVDKTDEGVTTMMKKPKRS
ncbi:SprT-like family-domain-containing protein [Circinella umbellata]|nr:SprT-like family-domain-containing protein [Circinella umbellata]